MIRFVPSGHARRARRSPRSAAAQSRHDSNAPINFGADHIELQDKANRALLSGNVSSSRRR